MGDPSAESVLWVEGKDDMHAIRHLLGRHDFDYAQESHPHWLPVIKTAGSKDKLLKVVKTTVSVAEGHPVGFVLDANSSLQDRWHAIATRLREVNVTLPEKIASEGFVGNSPRFRARVGVWLMPDNRREGTLEHFLATLIQEADPLLTHAREATTQAKQFHGASYSDSKKKKAILHAWLAWQEEPGLPYGTAIRARYFQHDSSAANSFVAWFRQVFEPRPDQQVHR